MKGRLKERLRDGELLLGTWSVMTSPALVEAIGYSGLDFIVIDAEHGPVNMESAENLIRAAELTGMAPIVRVSAKQEHLILRTLDIGAHGVQVPHVSTKEEAELVIEYSKYHPMGKRGLSPFTRAAKYGAGAADHVERSNEKTLVVLNIEGREGIENLEEIAGVDGVDVIFIGPYDLSQSIGKPGKVDDPEVIDLIRSSADIIKDNGLACGSFAKDMKYMELLVECGAQYLTYMVDTEIVRRTYKDTKNSFLKIKEGQ